MKKNILYGLAVLVITGLVFMRVPQFDFVLLDDTSHLDHNPYFRPLEVDRLYQVWQQPHLLYMPVTYTVWGLLGMISERSEAEQAGRTLTGIPKSFRFEPKAFHVATLVCHLGSVFFLYWILVWLSGSALASFCGSLLFAIHPVQVEPVAWVSGLKDTLSGFFSLLAILLFLLATANPVRKMRFYGGLALSTLALLFGLLSKPSTVVVPLIAFCLLALKQKQKQKQGPPRVTIWLKSRFLLLWVLLSIPFGLLVSQLQSNDSLGFSSPTALQRVLVAIDAFSFYFYKLLLPLQLAVDYGRTPEFVLSSPQVYTTTGLFLLFLIALNIFFYFNKMHWAFLCQSIVLLSLSPVLGFKSFAFQTTSTVSDRYLYLAMIGVAVALTLAIKNHLEKPILLSVVLGGLVFLGTRSYFQTNNWRDSIHLFTHNLNVNPKSWLSHNNLGSTYEKLEIYDQALYHFQRSASIKPQAICFNNRGAIHLSLKNFQAAKEDYEKALQLNPLSALDLHGVGLAYRGLGDLENAESSFAKATAIAPEFLVSANALRQVRREKRHK